MTLGFKCECGGYACFNGNRDRDSVKFGAIQMHCMTCGKRTGEHLGYSSHESIELAIVEWKTINSEANGDDV